MQSMSVQAGAHVYVSWTINCWVNLCALVIYLYPLLLIYLPLYNCLRRVCGLVTEVVRMYSCMHVRLCA